MSFTLSLVLIALALLGGMLVLMEAGRRLGRRHLARHPGSKTSFGPVEGAVFGLLGLVVALTFSGAASRFDSRRQLIAQEANALGTAYLRLDLLQAAERAPLQALFRRYADARIAFYEAPPGSAEARERTADAARLQGELWTRTVEACGRDARPHAAMLLLPALNEVLDITTTRRMAADLHPPRVIWWMLYVLAGAGALVAGYAGAEERTRNWIHNLGFAVIFAGTAFVIIDLENPRLGLIRLTAADDLLVEARASMR